MNDNETWVIFDTETTGLRNPVYPVEIAAQTMQGWQHIGNPLRMLLNFDVPIEPIAEKMHGYSRDYLRQHGTKPSEAFNVLIDYAGSYPLISYNLPFDWNRVLAPTIERIRLRSSLVPGFCALNLTRNVVSGMQDFKLKTVIKTFGLAEKQVHHAADDVSALGVFLTKHIGPHLQLANVIGYKKVAMCSEGRIAVPPLEVPQKQSKKKRDISDKEDLFAIGELVGICRAIAIDRNITDEEINFLAQWLENCPRSSLAPITDIYTIVREIVADGQITTEERDRLSKSIEEILAWKP